jgi:hypothetical protein
MIKKIKYLNPLHKIATCLVATHYGKEGYGGVPDAALCAVKVYGSGWINKAPKLKRDQKIRDFLKQLVKHSCPLGHSNWSQTWAVFQKVASDYAVLPQLPPANPKKKR